MSFQSEIVKKAIVGTLTLASLTFFTALGWAFRLVIRHETQLQLITQNIQYICDKVSGIDELVKEKKHRDARR